MKKLTALLGIQVLLIIVLSIVHIGLSNSISTTGIQLGKVQDEIAQLKKENTLLHEKILEASSLTSISEKAEKMGFTNEKSEVVLSSPMPIALKP